MKLPGFTEHELGNGLTLFTGAVPTPIRPEHAEFEALWELHPAEYHTIAMYGRKVNTPRWQQAYGRDYFFSGQVNRALPVPGEVAPMHDWVRRECGIEFNGILLNWYDGTLGHYIGPHRDNVRDLVPGSPIVTISLGEERVFRLRPWPRSAGAKPIDFPAVNGSVFVMPWETNPAFTHEVPKSAAVRGRRISVTFREFS